MLTNIINDSIGIIIDPQPVFGTDENPSELTYWLIHVTSESFKDFFQLGEDNINSRQEAIQFGIAKANEFYNLKL